MKNYCFTDTEGIQKLYSEFAAHLPIKRNLSLFKFLNEWIMLVACVDSSLMSFRGVGRKISCPLK